MNYEKKLALAKEALESGSYDKETIEYIFPELKESEDERIRKALIEYFNTHPKDYYGELKKSDILSFLKKQKPINDTDDDIIEAVKDSSVFDFVEPFNQFVLRLKKFKQGEWIVWKDKNYKVNYNGCGYELFDQNGLSTSWDYKTIEDNAHLWTVQDAKDGDVLVSKDNRNILIFRNLDTSTSFSSYYNIEGKGELGWSNECFIPATKEQRELLFSKMKEAGYEWDSEKKELKKIDYYCQEHCKGYQETGKCFVDGECQAKREAEQNPVWGEEDERMYMGLHNLIYSTPYCSLRKEFSDWLKSLKDKVQSKWKPENIHLEALRCVINGNNLDVIALKDLLEQLKRL